MASDEGFGPPPSGLDPEGVQLLLDVSQRIHAEVDPDAVLATVVDSLVQITGAERGFLMLRDAAGVLQFVVARDRHGRPLEAERFRVSRGVVDEVATTGETRLIDDASHTDVLQSRASVVQLRLRTVLCAPLRTPRGVEGVIYVDSSVVSRRFAPQDVPLVEAFAAQACAAIERVRLQQAERERERMRHELLLAADIQRTFLPSAFPPVPGVEGCVRTLPAQEVGGDVYEVCVPRPGTLVCFVGDVAGKGVPGALFGARLLSDLRHAILGATDPAAILGALNEVVQARATRGMFVTAILVVLDVASGTLTYVIAGHPPALVRRQDGKVEALARPSGLPLGVLADTSYATGAARLELGEVLLLVTDGLTDAADTRGEPFSAARLEAAFGAAPAGPAAVVEHLLAAVGQHAAGRPPVDDRMLLALMRTA